MTERGSKGSIFLDLRPPALTPLSRRRRFAQALLAWAVLFASSPGVVFPSGSLALAILGVGLWGATVGWPRGPQRWSTFLLEWLAAAFGCGAWMWWVWYVVPGGVAYIGLGQGIYMAFGGVLLRRLTRHLPISLAVGLAWVGAETLRTVLPPPFGLGWLRLGHMTHHHAILANSARVWGLEGLSFLVAVLGGAVAALLVERRLTRATVLGALLPLAAALGMGYATAPPELGPGPRLLLVQPGFEQERKMSYDPRANYAELRELTLSAIAAEAEQGHPLIDLVCWSETMLGVPLYEDSVRLGLAGGMTAPKGSYTPTEADLRIFDMTENAWVRGGLLGFAGFGERWNGALPPGTSFLVGAEVFDVEDGEIRRRNAVVLYGSNGRRSAPASKRYLVPGAETMSGFERFDFVISLIAEIAGYVPDFAPGQETGVFELVTREKERFDFSATVCFDNAFLAPYVEALHGGDVDFHFVASNEAWYRDSCEMDQMVAFSRIIAIATGRAVVRATNSGISTVLLPDGTELGRIEKDGRDRSIAGTIALPIPTPRAEEKGHRTPYVRLRTAWRGLWIVLALGLSLVFRSGAADRHP